MEVVSEQLRAYEEVIDLLARGASPAEIVQFRPSPEVQERVRELLAKNNAGTLTPDEAAELDEYNRLENFMGLLKARARKYLKP